MECKRSGKAARRVSLVLVIVGWCIAVVLCSCDSLKQGFVTEERMASKEYQERVENWERPIVRSYPIVGKWKRMRETWEFRADGKLVFGSCDVYGKTTIYYGWYEVVKWDEIKFRLMGLEGTTPVVRATAYVSGRRLYFRPFDQERESVYYRVQE